MQMKRNPGALVMHLGLFRINPSIYHCPSLATDAEKLQI